MGRLGIAGIIERCCGYASDIVDGIGALEGVEILWRPRINQGLVRFLDPRQGASDEDHDRFTDTIIRRVNESGEAFFAGTNWRGRRAMRVSVLNWRTSGAEVERAIGAVKRCLGSERLAWQ
jgi:aromatic-L-amino-acid decarboxylase